MPAVSRCVYVCYYEGGVCGHRIYDDSLAKSTFIAVYGLLAFRYIKKWRSDLEDFEKDDVTG